MIEKAKLACSNSGHRIEDHFADVSKMIEIGKGGRREINVTLLSRYACYLVIQNADPNKEIVAHGQTYFAIQTRRQELGDERIEDDRRLLLREEVRQHNVQLADAARDAGVVEPIDYAIFQNHGYMGLPQSPVISNPDGALVISRAVRPECGRWDSPRNLDKSASLRFLASTERRLEMTKGCLV